MKKKIIDEIGFDLHLQRAMARLPRGAPASVIPPSVRV